MNLKQTELKQKIKIRIKLNFSTEPILILNQVEPIHLIFFGAYLSGVVRVRHIIKD